MSYSADCQIHHEWGPREWHWFPVGVVQHRTKKRKSPSLRACGYAPTGAGLYPYSPVTCLWRWVEMVGAAACRSLSFDSEPKTDRSPTGTQRRLLHRTLWRLYSRAGVKLGSRPHLFHTGEHRHVHSRRSDCAAPSMHSTTTWAGSSRPYEHGSGLGWCGTTGQRPPNDPPRKTQEAFGSIPHLWVNECGRLRVQ